jgi:hypothetical protein
LRTFGETIEDILHSTACQQNDVCPWRPHQFGNCRGLNPELSFWPEGRAKQPTMRFAGTYSSLTGYRRGPQDKRRASVPMCTIDEELGALERDIRQLKIEYDQYFGGGRKCPPSEIEFRIERITKKYVERSADMKIDQRFRLNNLAQTYAKYKDIFR